jgi:pyruvate dehydrogenase E2 component (dihydrolipoamide acetyltransferase)
MTDFRLPDLGEGLDEAEIVSWHADVGDRVVADQPLVSVETAKAIVEIPSPRSGHIAKRFGEPGDVLKVGDRLVAFDDAEREDAASVVGEIPAAPREATAPPPDSVAESDSIRVAPAVRRRARELGIDLAKVAPSGAHGEITLRDLEKATTQRAHPGSVRMLSGPRRTMAHNMARARDQVVPATLYDDADIDHWARDADPTLRLVRGIAAASRAEATLNAWLDADNRQLRIHDQVDLGIAVDTEQGLFVPVLRDVGGRDDDDLRAGLQRLKDDVKARSIPPRELLGATFTLSNFGTLGGRYGALVVVPPQVAILGAGRVAPRAVVDDGEVRVHRVMPLSLTFDHRVITGGEAARFLAVVKDALES